ncbi:MAG: glycosyltransferase family 4 protein [Candidatus Eisenbacteria bacterium]|nr:glycosyltransferase family 4 protein [Candidatus Eisenbacteria bacterium]
MSEADHETTSTFARGPLPAALRIVLVAYRFPPQAGGGVQRPSKLVKYLADAGQEVSVVTGPEQWSQQDPTLLEDLDPDLVRVSVGDPSPFRSMKEFRRRANSHAIARSVQGVLWAMHSTSLPDLTNLWAANAFHRTVRQVVDSGADVIVVTGPPWSPLVLARLVSMATGVPLVVDYRDPWTENYLDLDSPRLQQAINPHIERWVLKNAAGVIAAHRAILSRLAPILPSTTPRIWIPNGYDPDDFAPAQARRPRTSKEKFVLSYTGSFFDRRFPGTLFAVLEDMLTNGSIDPERFQFRFAGDLGPGQRLLASLPRLAEVCKLEGYLSHSQSIDVLMQSDLNLVFESDGEKNLTTPAKFYEALAAERPVLLICPPGVTARVAERVGGCLVVDPSDAQGTREALLRAYEAWTQGVALPGPTIDRCGYYDRKRLALRVLSFLQRVVENKERVR